MVQTSALSGGALLLLIIGVTVTNTGLFILDRLAGLMGANVSGLSGYEDFVSLATGSAVLLLMPYCQHMRGHLSVNILSRLFPPLMNHVLDRLWLGVMLIAVIGLAVALAFGMVEIRDDQAVSRVLGWPVWPFLIPGIIGLSLWALVAIHQLLGRSHHG